MWRTPKAKFHFDNIYEDNPARFGPIQITQVGDLSCESGYAGGLHVQSAYEVTYVMDGHGEVLVNGEVIPVEKGMVVVNTLGESHNMTSSMIEPMRFFYLGFTFSEEADSPAFDELKAFFDKPPAHVAEDFFNIGKCFLNLFYELMKADCYTDKLIETYLIQILIMTSRAFQHDLHRRLTSDMFKSAAPPFIYDVMNYIDTKGYVVGRLNELSKEISYNYQYVSKVFSKYVGVTIKSYAEKRRFEKAVELLREDMKSSEVAVELGYNTIHAFSKAFKNYIGVSPAQYVETIKSA